MTQTHTQANFLITKKDDDQLSEIAKREGVDKTAIFRKAIKMFLTSDAKGTAKKCIPGSLL